jgi:hypothetical protein
MQPTWAIDPSQSLYINTGSHAPILQPYREAIVENLSKLMRDCGFTNSTVQHSWSLPNSYHIRIHFPLRINSRARGGSKQVPRTLEVEDQFSGARARLALIEGLPGRDEDDASSVTLSESGGGSSSSRTVKRRRRQSSATTTISSGSTDHSHGPRRSSRLKGRE